MIPSLIHFQPRWREELVATSPEGTLVFELTMGELHVRFPDLELWVSSAPEWAREHWETFMIACKSWSAGKGIPFSVVHNTFVYGLAE